jgi:hypothetical protein
MVGHKGVGIQIDLIPLFIFSQKLQIEFIIFVIAEDLLSSIAPRDDMIEGTGEVYPGFSSHAFPLTEQSTPVNSKLFMPDPIYI